MYGITQCVHNLEQPLKSQKSKRKGRERGEKDFTLHSLGSKLEYLTL